MKGIRIKLGIALISLMGLAQAGHAQGLVGKSTQAVGSFFAEPWQLGSHYFWANTQLSELDSSSGVNIYVRRTLAYDVGLELGYLTTDDFDFQDNVGIHATNSTEAVTLSLSGQGETGLFNSVFYAKMGVAAWDETTKLSTTQTFSDSGTSPFFGFSVKTPISNRVSVSFDTNYYMDMVRNGWLWDVGLGFYFKIND